MSDLQRSQAECIGGQEWGVILARALRKRVHQPAYDEGRSHETSKREQAESDLRFRFFAHEQSESRRDENGEDAQDQEVARHFLVVW